MKRHEGAAKSWSLGFVLMLLGFAGPLYAQPPERFRLDFSLSSIYFTDERVFLGGDFAPRAGLVGPTDILALFDVTGTVNVTERLSVSLGLPFGIVQTFREGTLEALFGEGETKFGIGDVHAEVGYQILGEKRVLPGVRVQAEGGAPTAEFAGLGTGLWRVTGRGTLSKSLSPRFSLFATGSYSQNFDKTGVDAGPITSYGGGVGIGITRATILTLQIEEVVGGRLIEDGEVVAPFTRDLHAGIGTTLFSKGRPRASVLISAAGLRTAPAFLLTVRWAILSL